MKKIAFATCLSFPDIIADDQPLVEELAKAGYQVEASPWDDPAMDWNSYTAIVIRSTWNYHIRKEAFKGWLSFLYKNKLRIFNPVEILEWNMDKRYLAGLQAIGVPVPESYYFEAGTHADLNEIFRTTGWEKAVIKPCVSATAFNTWIATSSQTTHAQTHAKDAQTQAEDTQTQTTDSQKLNTLLQEREYIVQEFMDEILSDGEYSLIFFNGRYSHAVKKTATPGDFRVQEQFGGISTPIQPDECIIRQAYQVLDSVKQSAPHLEHDLLYARVDGVIRNKIFLLMELELVEPSLFFNNDPITIKRFTGGLLEKMES